jgi:hypothetical protein
VLHCDHFKVKPVKSIKIQLFPKLKTTGNIVIPLHIKISKKVYAGNETEQRRGNQFIDSFFSPFALDNANTFARTAGFTFLQHALKI